MYKEFNCFDWEMTEAEVTKKVFFAIENNMEGVFISPLMVPVIKEIAPQGFGIATFVDYPLGMGDLSTRTHATLSCIRKGANRIDLMANMHFINNKQSFKFSEDIKANLEICKSNGADLRVVLEYKLYELPVVYKICEAIADIGVQYIIPSTDRILDDVVDNILVCHNINKKTGLKAIINAPIHKQIQIKCVKESRCYGVRVKSEKSYHSLKEIGV